METIKNYDPSYFEELSIGIEIEGQQKDCFVVSILKSEYGNYLALLPKEIEYIKNKKVLLFRCIENEEDIDLENIEDDAEYDFAEFLLSEVIYDSNLFLLCEKYGKLLKETEE